MTVNFGMISPYMTGTNLMDAPLMGIYTNPQLMGNPSFGMGYGMGMWTPQYQMQTIQQWDNFGIDRQVQGYQNQNNAQFKMAAQTEAISRQINVLKNQIKSNNQDNVSKEYDKLLVAVKNSYGSQMMQGLTEEQQEAQIKAYAERLYAQQTGVYITDDIRENSSSSFVSGIKQMLSFGFGNRTTAEENIAKIEGTDLTKKDRGAKIAGNVVGGLLGGVAAVAAFFIGKRIA